MQCLNVEAFAVRNQRPAPKGPTSVVRPHGRHYPRELALGREIEPENAKLKNAIFKKT